jgi:hypothetical protein
MLDGLDTRTLYNGGMNPSGENDDPELDSDEDWDTSEWVRSKLKSVDLSLLINLHHTSCNYCYNTFS